MDPQASQARAGDRHAALVLRLAGGDEAALAELYAEFAPRVLGLARRILRDESAAEEVAVEVFHQLWRQAGRFDAERGDAATWIATMARTRAIDSLRERARHEQRAAELIAAEGERAREPYPAPDQAASAHDSAAQVQRALARLPVEQRAALEAAYFGGLSQTQIAAALGAPLGTIKTRIRSGLCTLRTALGQNGGGIR